MNSNWMTPDCSDRRSKNSKQQGLSNQVAIDWRTPATQESGISVDRLEGELGGRLYDKETGRNAQYGLQQQINWQTPEARNQKGYHVQKDGSRIEKLGTQAGNGKLNPSWVEQLMNLSVGWTQLSKSAGTNENRIDRLRLLGNGVIPATAEKALQTLLKRFLND